MPELFGHMPSGEPVQRVSLANDHLRIQVITFGAVLQSIEAPDRSGAFANIVLGLTDLQDYVARSPHFGAVPGRYAGRIDGGRFTLDGVAYQLNVNKPPHTVHGGFHGFGKRNWSLDSHDKDHVALTLLSADGEEGFPGAVTATVRYTLDTRSLRIDYQCRDGPADDHQPNQPQLLQPAWGRQRRHLRPRSDRPCRYLPASPARWHPNRRRPPGR